MAAENLEATYLRPPHAVHLLLVADLMGVVGSLPSACLFPATILQQTEHCGGNGGAWK